MQLKHKITPTDSVAKAKLLMKFLKLISGVMQDGVGQIYKNGDKRCVAISYGDGIMLFEMDVDTETMNFELCIYEHGGSAPEMSNRLIEIFKNDIENEQITA